jgi:sugar lactone lactonase YvrE
MKKIFTVFVLLIAYHGYSQTNYVPNVTVSTFAGSASTFGSTNGQGTTASFDEPGGVATDVSGNVYVADSYNNLIRKITPGGLVSTLAGGGGFGFNYSGNTNGQGIAASFTNPTGVAVDANGNVYVADSGNNLIRKITSGGLVSTLAGSGTAGSIDGQGTAANFWSPQGVAVDASGNVYVGDLTNNLIRKITPGGLVSTLAGGGGSGFHYAGNSNGQGTAASFNFPFGVAVDANGNVYVADSGNNQIRKITPGGMVSTLAGSGNQGSADGQGTAANFSQPTGVSVDSSGNLYVADQVNNEIRKITPGGLVSTMAGSLTSGSVNGKGSSARFYFSEGVAVDASGNIYVADFWNNEIRKITIGSTNTATVNDINASSISVFPNPVKDLLNINVSEAVNGTLSVSDIQGSLVLSQPVNGKQIQLSTASLQNGIYVLNVVSDNASYVTRVVIAK